MANSPVDQDRRTPDVGLAYAGIPGVVERSPAGPGTARPDAAFGEYDYSGTYAAWLRRVVAFVFDSAILTTVAIILFGPGANMTTLPFFGRDNDLQGPGASGWHTAVIAVTVLVLLVCQAYLGATPGKRAVGIVVVAESTGKPIGLGSTVLRWLAHLLDAILMIGYLRPLWHAERKTIADSLLQTVVLHGPLPARFRSMAGQVPNPRPESRWVTLTVVAVCAGAVIFTLGPRSVKAVNEDLSCTPIPTSIGAASGMTFADVSLRHISNSPRTLWGISWNAPEAGDGVGVLWAWGEAPGDGEADQATGVRGNSMFEVEVELGSSDWAEPRTFSTANGGWAQSHGLPDPWQGWDDIPGTWSEDSWGPENVVDQEWEEDWDSGSAGLLLREPNQAAGNLGNDWTWSTRLLVDGELFAECATQSVVRLN